MRAPAADQVRAADEALAAVGALVGLLTRVDAAGMDEGGAHDEASGRAGTDRAAAAVDALVLTWLELTLKPWP